MKEFWNIPTKNKNFDRMIALKNEEIMNSYKNE